MDLSLSGFALLWGNNMKISKKQINKAGEIIRNGTVNEKEQTIELLNLWRANHMLPLRNIRAIVDSRLKKLSINCIVGQRLKRMPSIIGKSPVFLICLSLQCRMLAA